MSESESLKRPLFFSGKLLTAEDLALEQQYVSEKLKRHNRSLHGFGIVSGLKVTVESGKVVVDSGMALDCRGNEIVIGTSQLVSWPTATENWHSAYVNIRYSDFCSEAVTAARAEEASTTREGFEIVVAQDNSNRGHKHLRGRWLACDESHALTIAKLRRGPHGWRVDRGYRAPMIK